VSHSILRCSAIELKRYSSGKLLEKLWYPSSDGFSLFDYFFLPQKGASPEVHGALILSQQETRRYILPFSELYMLMAEVNYVTSQLEASSEIQLNLSYESKCLVFLDSWDGPLTVRISSTSDSITLDFIAHPRASGSFTFNEPKLLAAYFEQIHRRWCEFSPGLVFDHIWFIPLGGAFSVFDSRSENGTEITILQASDVFLLAQSLSTWDGTSTIIDGIAFSLQLSDSKLQVLQLLDYTLQLSVIELESLLSFFRYRLFLSESGSFSIWRDHQLKAYRK
jgi:hypothetical protein